LWAALPIFIHLCSEHREVVESFFMKEILYIEQTKQALHCTNTYLILALNHKIIENPQETNESFE